MQAAIRASLAEAVRTLDLFSRDESALQAIEEAARLLTVCFRQGSALYSCGNGGSMSDAMHFAEELSSRFRRNRPGLRAVAISDPAYLSCTANDFGYEQSFSRYIEAWARPGDVLAAFSTSGKSLNVLAAAREARSRGMKIIALTGNKENALQSLCDIHIGMERTRYSDRAQEIHIKVVHILVELVERDLFPELYADEKSN